MGYVALLGLLALVSTMALAFVHTVGVETAANRTRIRHAQSDYLAHSAANHALWRLLNEPDFMPAADQYQMHGLAGGRYGYKVRRPGATTFGTIAAVGAVEGVATRQSYVPYIIPSNLIAVYGRLSDPSPDFRRLVGAAFSDPADTLTAGSSQTHWIDLAGCPLRKEAVMAAIDDLDTITLAVWDGAAWGNAHTLGATGDRNYKCFGAAYESQSGRALAVGRSDMSTTAYYNIWDGAAWVHPTAQPAFNIAGGAIRTVEMAPCPGNNHILVATVSWNNVLELFLWDGAAFSSIGTIEASMDSDDYGSARLVYERQSGDALLIWAARGAVRFRVWNGASLAPETTIGHFTADVFFLSAAPDPNSDHIIAAGIDKFYDLTVAVWDGDAWIDGREIETSTAHNNLPGVDVAWEAAGDEALVAWAPWGATHLRTLSWQRGAALADSTVQTGPDLGQQPWLVALHPLSQSEKIVVLGLTNTEVLGYSLWTGDRIKGDPAVVLAGGLTAQNDRIFALAEADVPITGGIGSGTVANQPPVVDASEDQTICSLHSEVKLHGTVSDDGLPPPGLVAVAWSKVSGPGTVTFANPNMAETGVSVSAAGEYVLRLTADDGDLQSYDEVTIQWELSDETLVNTETVGSQSHPAVAVNSGGSMVVAWAGENQDGDGWGIFAQRFDSTGTPAGGEFQVHTSTTGDQLNPAVAMDDAGNFVIAWQTQHVYLTTSNIYAQRFDAAGAKVDGEFRVDAFTGADMVGPAVAMAPTGEFIIAFEAGGGFDGNHAGIYARRYDAAGVGQGGGFKVNTYYTNDQRQPSAAMDSNANIVITWESFNQDDSGYGVYGQRYDAAGTKQGAEFRVNTTTASSQGDPCISMNDAGFAVVWEGYNAVTSGYDIYLQRFDASGLPLGGEFIVNSTMTDTQLNPTIRMNASGVCIVAWQGNNQDGWGNGVFGQLMTLGGVIIDPEFQINTTTANEQIYPAVGIDAATSYVAAWSGNGAGDTDGTFKKRFCLPSVPLDTKAPEPDPMTWLKPPTAMDAASIAMMATTATDINGVEYYFECVAGGCHDSGWQSSSTYADTGLASATTYTYRVKARDLSAGSNETGWSAEASATTLSDTIYVNDIEMGSRKLGQTYYGQAKVWIKAVGGSDVAGATVSGDWSGSVTGSSMGSTGADGRVLLESPGVKSGGTFTFTVTGVVKTGFTYTPGLNLETSDTITAP
jgi:hypothetical protein